MTMSSFKLSPLFLLQVKAIWFVGHVETVYYLYECMKLLRNMAY